MAENTNPKTLNDTGDAYFYGIGRPINRELAYTYYKQAADLDNPIGMFNLGQYFASKADYKTAVQYYEKAKAFLHPPAFMALAKMFETGVGARKNKGKAFKMYLGAAKLADIEAYNAVGLCYKNGIGIKKDATKAIEYFQKSADQNDPAGEYQLGLLLMETPEYKKNPEKAFHWLDKAATSGHVEAMKKLLSIYVEGKHPAFQKKSRLHLGEMAFYYRELLAKAKDVGNLIVVADAYYQGTDVVKKNQDKASLYYRMLLDMNEVAGKYGYALCLLYGQGVRMNVTEAKRLFDEAAAAKHVGAMTRLGDIARLGLEKNPDNEEAKRCYMDAARLQDPEAIMNLGLLNYRNLIEGSSPALAFNYMDTAAKKGYFQALYWLGIFHDKGIGCERDFSEAEKCFKKAIASNSLGAKYKYASMIFDEIEAQKLKPKKTEEYWMECRKLFIEYVEDLQHNPANHAFSMHYLGLIHLYGKGTPSSARRARFWFESAAEAGLSKAMVELYRLMREHEFVSALEWLDKALADQQNADAAYEKALLYIEGHIPELKPNLKAGRALLDAAARLNHKDAIAKLMLL